MLKREDCQRTEHDSDFSEWKILVGPSDWEDYSVGKEGGDRYRVHNLPIKESPGVYELGIAVLPTGLGREVGKPDRVRIVPVYLGQADNVRTRLQQYGRSGAHLGNGSTGHPSDHVQKEIGLFRDIFSRGCSIVYRWAPMENKSDATKRETRRLSIYDYPWNTRINGARQPNDVIEKIPKKKVDIRIGSRNSPSVEDKLGASADGESNNPHFRVFKFGRSQPRLVLDRSGITQEDTTTCGVTVGDGSICRTPPVPGRKRCAEHKGMRINELISVGISNSNVEPQCTVSRYREFDSPHAVEPPLVQVPVSGSSTSICGFILADGYPCRRHPPQGRKRCDAHKGMRINGSIRVGESNTNVESQCTVSSYRKFDSHAAVELGSGSFTSTCGFILANGSPCRRHPPQGRKRCDAHKGRRIQ